MEMRKLYAKRRVFKRLCGNIGYLNHGCCDGFDVGQ